MAVSKLNECDDCVMHRKPFPAPERISPEGADRVLDYRAHPEFDKVDRLVVEYRIAAWTQPSPSARQHIHGAARAFQRSADRRAHLAITLCGFFDKFNDALQINEDAEARAAALA